MRKTPKSKAKSHTPLAILPNEDASPKTKKLGANVKKGSTASTPAQALAEYLEYILEPGQIIYVFVNGTRRREGYYDQDHLHKLAADLLKHNGTAQGIYHGLNPVDLQLLSRVKNRLERAVAGVSPRNEDVTSRRLLLIDFDPVRPPEFQNHSTTKEELKCSRLKAIEVRNYLTGLNWPMPIRIMSGNGTHLLYRIDVPTDDGGLVKRVLQTLSKRFSDAAVKIDTAVHDARRITKLPGTKACKGVATSSRPHRTSRVSFRPKKLLVVPTKALERLATQAPVPILVRTLLDTPVAISPQHIQRTTNYLANLPPAIEGQNGSNRMFATVALLLNEFALPRTVAFDLVQVYNKRCVPPFSQDELEHKFDDVSAKIIENGGPTGSHVRDLLEAGAGIIQSADLASLTGPMFPIEVPDYSWLGVDAVGSCLASGKLHRMRAVWAAIGLLHVWQLQKRRVDIPDILLAHIYWGPNPPERWKRRVRDWLMMSPSKCPSACPFHSKPQKNSHYRLTLSNKQNLLYQFAETENGAEVTDFNFHTDKEPWKSRRQEAINDGLIMRGYWPVLIFGHSPSMGMTLKQVLLMYWVTRELTRVGYEWAGQKKSGKPTYRRTPTLRADRADTYRNRHVPASGKGTHMIACPLIDEAKEYVGFNNNLKFHHGRGYKLLGDAMTWTSRMEVIEGPALGLWDRVRNVLDDFAVLADLFGLIIAGRHHPTRRWASLEEMRHMLGTGFGQDWLQECMVRIYAPADYLVRWRHKFAERLGFSWIPGGEDCPFPLNPTTNGMTIRDGRSLAAWLRATGLTQQELADELHVSVRSISRRISASGMTTRTTGFWESVNQLAASRATVSGHTES